MAPSQPRRTFLRVVGATGATMTIAGCLGGGDGSGDLQTTESSQQGSSSDWSGGSDPESWREKASAEAEKELDGSAVNFYATSHNDVFREKVIQREFEDVYSPLTGKINMVTGPTAQQQAKYVRETQAGKRNIDVMDFRVDDLASQGVEFGDLTVIPSYKAAPDDVKTEPYRGSIQLYAYGINYNPDLVSEPPSSFEDVLDDRFADGQILLDFTPSAIATGALMEMMGDDYIRQLKGQNPVQIKSGWGISKRTGQGQAKIAFLGILPHNYRAQQSGLSLKPVQNSDIWIWFGKPLAMAKRPKHPWAAKLFIDFLMHPEHEQVQAPRPGTLSLDKEYGNPPEVKDLYNGRLWSLTDFNQPPDEINERYQELLGSPVT